VICYVKLGEKRWYEGKNLIYVISFMLLCLIGWTSVIITIVDIIQGNS